MAKFLAGLVSGALLTWLLLGVLPASGPREDGGPDPRLAPPAPTPAALEADLRTAPAPVLEGVEREVSASPARAPEAAPTGALGVRVGQGIDLVRWALVEGPGALEADLYCLEVASGSHVAFRCRRGGAIARYDAESRPVFHLLDAAEAASRLTAVPDRLEPGNVTLSTGGGSADAGVAFVAATDGRTWAIWVERIDAAESALDRVAWVGRREPPGERGDAALPPQVEALTTTPLDATEVAATIARAVAANAFPSAGTVFRQFGWRVAKDPPLRSRLEAFHQRIAFPNRFDGSLSTGPHAGLLFQDGTGERSNLRLEHHSAAIVRGTQQGEIKVTDHALLEIDGDLAGHVRVEGHGILVLRGDLRGTLELGSHAKVAVLGALRGTLDLAEASHARLMLAGSYGRLDIEKLPRPGPHSTLHVERSDLPAGENKEIGAWQAVWVAEESWRALPR